MNFNQARGPLYSEYIKTEEGRKIVEKDAKRVEKNKILVMAGIGLFVALAAIVLGIAIFFA